jgi:phage-related protein
VAYGPTRVTGQYGTNMGLTNAKPVITVYCTGGVVELIEDINNQKLTIDEEFVEGTILTIDIANRTITDTSDESYVNKVTINSTWPKLYGEYDFSTSMGGLIQKVEYKEGY